MPELPEVETVVRDLRPLVVGRRITAVRVGAKNLRRPWQAEWSELILGKRIDAIRRRGKWIVVELSVIRETKSSDERPRARLRLAANPRLILHLGMTGQLTVHQPTEPLKDHTHLIFELGRGHELRFRDVRRFGSADVFVNEAEANAYLAERLGPEPMELEAKSFQAAVLATIRPLKAVLLDQSVVAGVGNIYADEALHRSGLHPERRGNTLQPKEIDRLREAIVAVIEHAIEHRGSTIRDYIGGSGLKGEFQNEFRVYGRTGEACPVCETAIEVVRVAGRSSHYCGKCQPVSRETKSSGGVHRSTSSRD